MDNNEPVNLKGANSKVKSTIKKNGSNDALSTMDDASVSYENSQ